ncbi:MAG: hypothetical protein E6I86_03760 [Chloroflexi bacterium]|nr:MAG: hypothetical protein E6I86_03760 [Chloroflexota bacterium]
MSKADRREILSRVAAGTISPEEAAAQLDAVAKDREDTEPRIRCVRVIKRLGAAEVIGDPNVRDAVADGQHRARIDGDVMIIEGETANEPGTFITRSWLGFPEHSSGDRLVVRVNPALELDLQVQAGSLRVNGVDGPIRADVQASSATIDGFRKPLDLKVQAGSIRANGRLDDGESRIACDAGSVNLHLERGSSVRVNARAHLGKITLPGEAGDRGAQDVTIGDGTASLVIETNMGSVRVTADQ